MALLCVCVSALSLLRRSAENIHKQATVNITAETKHSGLTPYPREPGGFVIDLVRNAYDCSRCGGAHETRPVPKIYIYVDSEESELHGKRYGVQQKKGRYLETRSGLSNPLNVPKSTTRHTTSIMC